MVYIVPSGLDLRTTGLIDWMYYWVSDSCYVPIDY